MALNITVHSPGTLRHGAMPVASPLNGAAAQVVALGAQSSVIAGPCTLCLIADEGQRVSLQQLAGYAAPAASGIKLVANVERWYELPAGNWYVSAVAG